MDRSENIIGKPHNYGWRIQHSSLSNGYRKHTKYQQGYRKTEHNHQPTQSN